MTASSGPFRRAGAASRTTVGHRKRRPRDCRMMTRLHRSGRPLRAAAIAVAFGMCLLSDAEYAPALASPGSIASIAGSGFVSAAAAGAQAAVPAYPLKPGPTGRYLVDQNNVPFMIVGDSPQSL